VTPAQTVERYLACVAGHDWAGLAECLTEDVVRVGPFGDTYTPRGRYVAFLENLMPTLEEYSMRVDRVLTAEGGTTVTVELTETMRFGGRMVETPEALVFDLSDDGRIRHIGIFIRTLPEG
jgi:ketosteroid isomerase-like protein